MLFGVLQEVQEPKVPWKGNLICILSFERFSFDCEMLIIMLYLYSVTGTICKVIKETQDQVEVSFSRTWNFSLKGKSVPLKIDKRFSLITLVT